MKEITIKLNQIDDLKEFDTIVAKCNFDVDAVSTVNSRYTIDAKSIMGLFGLDLSRPVKIVAYGTDEEVKLFFEKIKKFKA